MNMKGLDRSLRYYTRQAQIYVLSILGGSLAMTVYMWLINSDTQNFQIVLKSIPGWMLYISFLVLFSAGVSAGQSTFSLLLSFGCCRRHIFWGNAVMNLLIVTETMLLFKIAAAVLMPEGGLPIGLPGILAVCFVLEGISQLAGIAATKWGRKVYMLIVFVFIGLVTGFAVCGGMVLSSSGDISEVFLSILSITQQWWVALCGAGICAVANVVAYRVLSCFEVKQ